MQIILLVIRQESLYHVPDRYDDAKHKRTIMSAEGVIDWDEAMEQCGDDEEFLRELLADLRGEVDQQVKKIDEMLTNVSGLDSTLLRRERRRGWVDGTTAVLEGSSDVETGKRTRFVWETCTYLEYMYLHAGAGSQNSVGRVCRSRTNCTKSRNRIF